MPAITRVSLARHKRSPARDRCWGRAEAETYRWWEPNLR
jgi:hypothetical protein